MSAVFPHTAAPAHGADAAPPPPTWENHSARFSTTWDTGRVVITADGELDASNATQFADYFDLCIAGSTPLVVDLSGLKFFGTAGFSALHLINVRCAAEQLRWAVVPSKAVSRLLGICDPDHALPVIASVHSSWPDADSPGDRLFQLVP